MKTAVEQLLQDFQEYFPKQIQDMYENNQLLFESICNKSKTMENHQKIEFALKAYNEKFSTDKSFVDVVNNMLPIKSKY
jgi:ribosomal protein S17E